MFPVAKGIHMLLACLQAVEGTRACVTFPHDGRYLVHVLEET